MRRLLANNFLWHRVFCVAKRFIYIASIFFSLNFASLIKSIRICLKASSEHFPVTQQSSVIGYGLIYMFLYGPQMIVWQKFSPIVKMSMLVHPV